MNTEYVYFVFYQFTDLPLNKQKLQRPIEYKCRDKIEDLSQYKLLESYLKRKLCTDEFIITGLTYLREIHY